MSEVAARRRWPDSSRILIRRIAELAAASSLADLRNAPGRCHALAGTRAGQYALRLSARTRLVFEPFHDPVPRVVDGGIDLSRVTAVRILDVADYHDG